MFRFSIRELMLVTLVVAVGIGWWLDRRNNARWQKRAGALEYLVREKGYRVVWEADRPVVHLFEGRTAQGIDTLSHEPSRDVSFGWKSSSQPCGWMVHKSQRLFTQVFSSNEGNSY